MSSDGRFLPIGNNPMLFDPYAYAAFDAHAMRDFANIEIQPVEEMLDTDGFVEDYQVPSQAPTMFTVYLRHDPAVSNGFGGVMAVGDFGTANKARIYARGLKAYFARRGMAIDIVDFT